jgi:hypothetical protein
MNFAKHMFLNFTFHYIDFEINGVPAIWCKKIFPDTKLSRTLTLILLEQDGFLPTLMQL